MVAWAFAASEEKAAPEVVRRTRGQVGVPWISDGQAVYRREVQRVYRDHQRIEKPGRPHWVLTPGVGLTQVVRQRLPRM